MTKTEQEIAKLAKPIVEKLGYKLYDVLYVKEASDWFLRFFIDKDDGKIDLDDCEKVSEKLGEMLDEKDPISESYNLEVSSCGMERHLREPIHFKEAVGKNILVKLFKPQDGKKEFSGTLLECDDSTLKLKDEAQNKEVVFFLEDISMSKILFNWEEFKNE